MKKHKKENNSKEEARAITDENENTGIQTY
jgi:hypothetical protein